MAKPTPAPAPAAAPAPAQAGPAPLLLVAGPKPPRIAGHTSTKNGKGGTAGTWALIAAHMAANGGTITFNALQAICADNGDKHFARYALGKQRQWLVPAPATK